MAYNSELGLDSSDELTHFNNHDISDKNMTCADCIKNLWDDMARKTKLLKELHALVLPKPNVEQSYSVNDFMNVLHTPNAF